MTLHTKKHLNSIFTSEQSDLIRTYYPWLARLALKTKLPDMLWYDIQKQAKALGVTRDAHLSRINLTEPEFQHVLQTFTHRAGVIIEIHRALKRPTKDVRRFIQVLITHEHLPSDTGTPAERRERKYTHLWQLLTNILKDLPTRYDTTQVTSQLQEIVTHLRASGWFRHRVASITIAYALVCFACKNLDSKGFPKFSIPTSIKNAVPKLLFVIGKEIEDVLTTKSHQVVDPTSISLET